MSESKLSLYLAPVLKILLFVFFLLACAIPVGLIAQLNFLPTIKSPILADVLTQVGMVFVVLGALLMIFKVLPNLDFYEVFIRKERALSDFAKGTAVGFGIMVLCAATLYLSGNVTFILAVISWDIVFLYLVYFFLIAIFEEFMFRSYPLFVLSERYPLWLAIFLNGFLFASAHLANPEISLLGLFNILLVGVLLSLYTLQKGNISWAVGIHFGWNFTQAVILGYKVSGNNIGGAVEAIPKGADYLSGGNFGLEGSIVCTLFLAIYIVWLVYGNKLKLRQTYNSSL